MFVWVNTGMNCHVIGGVQELEDQTGRERKCYRYTETVLLSARTPGVTGAAPGEKLAT